MIDENAIMPYNFFKYGGVYSGDHYGMRYIIKRVGEKPDYEFCAMVWRGPYASGAVSEEDIVSSNFHFDEEGRLSAINWIKRQYDERLDYWEAAPSILAAPPIVHE